MEMVRREAADVMIAGASEAALVPVAMAGMNVMTALSTRNDSPQTASRPFDKDRDGFLMGEGAGVLILESSNTRRLAEQISYVRLLATAQQTMPITFRLPLRMALAPQCPCGSPYEMQIWI